MNTAKVIIRATDDEVLVKVVDGANIRTFAFGTAVGDGYLTGADLSEVLGAAGIQADYTYGECDCEDRSWYGPAHDSACPVTAARAAAKKAEDA